MGLSGIILAQSPMIPSAVTPLKHLPSLVNSFHLLKEKDIAGAETPSFESVVNNLNATPQKNKVNNHSVKAYTQTNIGTTGYQLQTNAAICNRVIKSSDGTISATWTMSQLMDDVWADRGTGYNYFNGTSWGAIPTVRIENIRTGFTNIGVTATGAEVVVTHEAANIHVASRPVKGTGAWSNAALGFPDVWSRLAVGGLNGISLHIISQTSGVGTTPYMGQNGALAYTRSLDGGLTWDKIRTVIPQIDSSSYRGFGGDAYAIDAKGDTIVIVAGGWTLDVVMIKSIDNGNTWTKTVIDPFPIPLYNEATMITDTTGDAIPDTIPSNDASLSVLLDNQGMAHVWFGNVRIYDATSNDAAYDYLSLEDGLMYWNENMGASAPVMIASAEDINANGILDVTAMGSYRVGLCSHASSGIAPDGKIYASYSGIYEGDADGGSPGVGKSFRHTYVMCSTDGGTTWCTPHDVTDPGELLGLIEGVYGAMAKDVDGFVHLIIEQDGSVGHGVTATPPPVDPQGAMADIIYTKIPVADLYTICNVGINETSKNDILTNLYPNPATSSVTLSITTLKKESVKIKICNVLGEIVNEFTNEIPTAGTFDFTINLEKMSKGVYFVNLTMMDGKAKTSKLVVE